MLVESLTLENIKCFESQNIRFSGRKWVTLLGPNGCGKSTILQSLALLLAGPEGAQQLLKRPVGWLLDESSRGKIGIGIQQSNNDPGQFGIDKVRRHFNYSFAITGTKPISVGNKRYTEPSIIENSQSILTWLRQNALTSTGEGWFAVGYGAFRRLTRRSQIIVPSLEPQARFTNFITQFVEDDPLSAFEQWMVYLDFRIAKGNGTDTKSKHQRDIGIEAINSLLPGGMRFDSVTSEGRILFEVNGAKVPTTSLSDGYRSVLALAGDLVWRLVQSFPGTEDPLHEEGVVLVDELDIHLHPIWQRDIAQFLQRQFPNLQFIVATHSPLIASGAGDGALTLKCEMRDGKVSVENIKDISALRVDYLLQSTAFGLVSPYSPQAQRKIDRYDGLVGKTNKTVGETREFEQLQLFMRDARPIVGPRTAGSLNSKIDAYLESNLS